VLIEWKDGSLTWVALKKDAKELYPVQLAEYAAESRILEQPAFAWRVPFTLRRRNRILAKVESKYWVRTHTFGLRIPKTVKEALTLDAENGDTQEWWDTVCKEEMRYV
jgi:hypothetical protein